jgi:hypothetical protein
VAGLPLNVQGQIAADVRTGAEPSKVVARFLDAYNCRPKKAHQAFDNLIHHLHRGIDGVNGVVDQISGRANDRKRQLGVLKRAQRVIGRLIVQIQKN